MARNSVMLMHKRCSELLNQQMFSGPVQSQSTQNLDATLLLAELAWKVLAPIVVILLGGLSLQAAKDWLMRIRNEKGKLSKVEDTIELQEATITRERYEQCITEIETILSPYSISRRTVKLIVQETLKACGKTIIPDTWL